jgi:hypothetical protein
MECKSKEEELSKLLTEFRLLLTEKIKIEEIKTMANVRTDDVFLAKFIRYKDYKLDLALKAVSTTFTYYLGMYYIGHNLRAVTLPL